MPTGYSLPHDTPLIKQAKINSVVTSNVSISLSSILQLSYSLKKMKIMLLVKYDVIKSHTLICLGEVQGGLWDDEG